MKDLNKKPKKQKLLKYREIRCEGYVEEQIKLFYDEEKRELSHLEKKVFSKRFKYSKERDFILAQGEYDEYVAFSRSIENYRESCFDLCDFEVNKIVFFSTIGDGMDFEKEIKKIDDKWEKLSHRFDPLEEKLKICESLYKLRN